MKLGLLVPARPIILFIVLVLMVLVFPSVVIPYWYKTSKQIESEMSLISQNLHSGLQEQVESIGRLLNPLITSSAAATLAKFLNSSTNATQLQFSFDVVKTTIAPSLFQAFSTMPYLSQISFLGFQGFFFSYYMDGNQTWALYSNTTFFSGDSKSSRAGSDGYLWYKQPVLVDHVGELYGEATRVPQPLTASVDSGWFHGALNKSNGCYASLGRSWSSDDDFVLLNSARINGKAAISLGFSVKALTSFFTDLNLYGGSLYLATSENQTVLIPGIQRTDMVVFTNRSISLRSTEEGSNQVQVLCNPSHSKTSLAHFWELNGTNFDVYCGMLDLFGVETVYALALPHKGLARLTHKTIKSAWILLMVMIVAVVISIFGFVLMMMRATKREMHLRLKLIHQMEVTQQAERKSMDKSLAISRASHDIRASLAAIIGLIDLCYELVPGGSDLHKNLKEMESNAKELLGLLTSILDISKLEAGKLQLEEEKFNLNHLLERVADLFHPLASEKGVDVVLDPCDGSILKFHHVKGDRKKLYQILINLLSNAVKFTKQGHVSLRAWAKKPTLVADAIASNQSCFARNLPCLFWKNRETSEILETGNVAVQDPDVMEFVFEVDDTGIGIPKEKHKSVFENYVQVKETSPAHQGTGLGLGIVRLLVRLMSGEIDIVDKDISEKGTCFRFNVFLSTYGDPSSSNASDQNVVSDYRQAPGSTICPPSISIRISSPRLQPVPIPIPKHEGSQVILLILNNERRRMVQKFMVSRGINVATISQWDHLPLTLQKMKHRLISPHNSLSRSEWSSRSDISCSSSKDVPLSAMDGSEQLVVPANKRRVAPCFFLLVIDVAAGPFQELFKAVVGFRRGLGTNCCKVVWLDKPKSENIGAQNEDCDEIVLRAPLHGSRLYKVIELIPGHEGSLGASLASERDGTCRGKNAKTGPGSSATNQFHIRKPVKPHQHGEIQEECSSDSGRLEMQVDTCGSRKHQTQKQQLGLNERKENVATEDKKLSGKTILVVDDAIVQRKITSKKLENHGAVVEQCEDGKKALELVCNRIKPTANRGGSISPPYDFILMDCEMKDMDGYEASRQIREEESKYGSVRVPIIALTAHDEGEVANKISEAGMDCHMQKPLKMEDLFKVLTILK